MISSDPAAPPAPPLVAGVAITAIVVFAVVSWIVAAAVLKLPSYAGPLVVFWYWTTLGRTDFRTLAPAILGAMVGIGVIALLRVLLGLGVPGMVLGVLLFGAAILVDIMRWIPWAVNSTTLLTTTVLGIPVLMYGVDYRELVATTLLGSGWLFLVAFVAVRFAPKPEV